MSAYITSEIIKIDNLLIERFGIPYRPKILPDPVEMVIATILSQNTNDKNSYRAYENLISQYSDWDDLADESITNIINKIKIAGLAKQKANSIKSLLMEIRKTKGSISLNDLYKTEIDESLEYLIGFNGVGLKTAACVLLFSIDKNLCPVDTHVHRTLNRIGIVSTSTPDRTFKELKSVFPKEKIAHSFHTNLIRLGREICKPKSPDCNNCPLLKICKYNGKNLEHKTKTESKSNSFMLLDNVKSIKTKSS